MTDTNTEHATLVHAGIDYITATAHGRETAMSLFALGDWLTREEVTKGNSKRPWSFSGFHGYRSGGAQFGTRNEEVIVRASSDCAHDYWKQVKEASDNVSRLDVQFTLRLNGPVGPTIRRHFEQAKRFSQKRKQPATLSVLSTNNGPSTLYFNRRISDRFGRIYDKGAESKLDALQGCVRYEVELKGKQAMSVSAALVDEADADLRAALIAAEFFDARGVTLGKLGDLC